MIKHEEGYTSEYHDLIIGSINEHNTKARIKFSYELDEGSIPHMIIEIGTRIEESSLMENSSLKIQIKDIKNILKFFQRFDEYIDDQVGLDLDGKG